MLNPAAPTLAEINDPTNDTVDIDFDANLIDNPALAVANWTVRYLGNNYTVSAAAADGIVVTLTVAVGAPDPGLDIVSFTPPPHDLISANGRPVLEFIDFPLIAPG